MSESVNLFLKNTGKILIFNYFKNFLLNLNRGNFAIISLGYCFLTEKIFIFNNCSDFVTFNQNFLLAKQTIPLYRSIVKKSVKYLLFHESVKLSKHD